MKFYTIAIAILTAGCAYHNPTEPSVPPAAHAGIVLAAFASELQAFNEPLDVYAGGGTQVKVGAFGIASDGNMRSIPGLPVHLYDGWRYTAPGVDLS